MTKVSWHSVLPFALLGTSAFVPTPAFAQSPNSAAAAEAVAAQPVAAEAAAAEPPAPTAPPEMEPSAEAQPSSDESVVSYTEEVEPPMMHSSKVSSADDPDAIFRTFSQFAAGERAGRYVRAGAGVVVGGATIGIGAYVASETDGDATTWYIVGGVLAGASLLGFVMPSPAEKVAFKYQTQESGHSEAEAAEFERVWKNYAEGAKKQRLVSSAVTTILAGVGIGYGIAVATGSGNYGESDRLALSSVLIGGGAAALVPSVAGFFVKGSTERAYDAYLAGKPQGPAVALGFSGARGGLLLSAGGEF